jgi:hypothetical protein
MLQTSLVLDEGLCPLPIRIAPDHNWPSWKRSHCTSLSSPGALSWREGARVTKHGTPIKSAGVVHFRGGCTNLSECELVVTAYREWLTLGDADGVRRMWPGLLPHLKAEGLLPPQSPTLLDDALDSGSEDKPFFNKALFNKPQFLTTFYMKLFFKKNKFLFIKHNYKR